MGKIYKKIGVVNFYKERLSNDISAIFREFRKLHGKICWIYSIERDLGIKFFKEYWMIVFLTDFEHIESIADTFNESVDQFENTVKEKVRFYNHGGNDNLNSIGNVILSRKNRDFN